MRNFWGFYDNGIYRVGCNGGTIYVYDQKDNELAKFRDIRYAYCGTFQPGKNVFVAKSTEGLLAVYDLDKMALTQKIVITRDGAQDEGFAFTPDGAYFYNIEKPIVGTKTQLTVYRSSDFRIEHIFFKDEEYLVLDNLEFDPDTGTCYVIGFTRDKYGTGFIGIHSNGNITNFRQVNRNRHEYIRAYINWRTMGFTKKSLEWSWFKYNHVDPVCDVTLKSVYEQA